MIIYPLPPSELDDKTLSEQIKLIAHTLCNIHHYYNNKNIPLRENYFHSQLQVKYRQWARECRANYLKLVEMGLACCKEWKYRHSNINCFDEGSPEINQHKLQPVIEWAVSNIPDLAVHIYEKDEMGDTVMKNGLFGNQPTPFPIVMPDKYIGYKGKSQFPGTYTDEPDIEQSYRNYYRAKLQKKINKIDNTIGCGCNNCDINFENKKPTWSRRDTPTFLNGII